MFYLSNKKLFLHIKMFYSIKRINLVYVNIFLFQPPDVQVPEFPGSESLTCPNTFDKQTLSKMMRRWYRHGFVTGFYRFIC